MQPEINEEPNAKPKWKTNLNLKADSTVSSYEKHIKAFIKSRTNIGTFEQDDINHYFAKIKEEDDRKPDDQRESIATKSARKAALRFYLNDCLGLTIDFKKFKTKSTR